MVWLVDAKYIKEYQIFVKFNDGKEAILDLENYIKSKPKGTVFDTIKELKYFQNARFSSDLDNVVWDNGVDIAPERLYEMINKYQTEQI